MMIFLNNLCKQLVPLKPYRVTPVIDGKKPPKS